MQDFLVKNLPNIITIIVFIGICLVLVKRGYTPKVKEMLFWLVIRAEEMCQGGTGAIKFSAVVTMIYNKLPSIVQLLFTQKQMEALIEEAVQRMKDYLKANPEAQKLIEKGELSKEIYTMND